jgi:hypothetical protein
MSGPRPNGETHRTKWIEVGSRPEWATSRADAYRIWMMWDGFGWQQRHEWRNKDGSVDLQDWIRSASIPPGDHYELVAA